MLLTDLSESEKIIIYKCSNKIIESYTRLFIQGHEYFENFVEAYKEFPDVKLDLVVELQDQLELWENIRESPEEYIPKLSITDILAFKLVISQLMPEIKLPKSTRSLLSRLDSIIGLKNINLN